MPNLSITKSLPTIFRPSRSMMLHPIQTPTPIRKIPVVCKGVRMVTKQQGSLNYPDTPYRCQIISCCHRSKKKQLPEPQIPCYVRDKKWKNKHWEWTDKETNMARCLLCDKRGKYGSIQQHSKQHFLPEYECLDCGDAFHIKGQWQQHFLLQCPHCDHVAKGETNLKTHIKTTH